MLDTLHEQIGIGPRAAYEPLCELARSIVRLVQGEPMGGPQSGTGTGIRSVRNESRTGTRLVVELQTPADVEGVTAALVALWPIRRAIAARFEQPLAGLIRKAASDRDGLDERLALIEWGTRP